MIMGGEIYLPGYETAWAIGRELGLQIAAHIVGTFGMRADLRPARRAPTSSAPTTCSST